MKQRFAVPGHNGTLGGGFHVEAVAEAAVMMYVVNQGQVDVYVAKNHTVPVDTIVADYAYDISSIDGIDFQETIFPFETDTIFLFERGGNDTGTWQGINPDGSWGSCSACHARHEFSVEQARQPEACGKCHLGPDHPQKEIYEESKHGVAYRDLRDEMNLDSPEWVLGQDYAAAPTCATFCWATRARSGSWAMIKRRPCQVAFITEGAPASAQRRSSVRCHLSIEVLNSP